MSGQLVRKHLLDGPLKGWCVGKRRHAAIMGRHS